MKRTVLLFLSLVIAALSSGCTQDKTTTIDSITVETTQPEDVPPGSYPPPTTINAYPAPGEEYVFRSSVPGTATIHGLLLVMDPDQSIPDPNDGLFLVPLPESEGVVMLPTFVVGEVPQADVNEVTGEFVFTDITPGRYVMMVLTIHQAQIPVRTADGSFAIYTISEDDLDTVIEVQNLRIP